MSFSFKPAQVGGEVQGDSVNSPSVSTPNSISLGSMPLGGRIDSESGKSIIQVALYVIFGVSIIIAVLLFAYQRYLVSRIESQKQVLDESDKALGALNLEGMRALSNRMKVVNQVLNEHASVSTAFLILEKSIEHPITYTKFSLTRNETAKGYDLILGAVAPSYKAVAQQLDTLNSTEYKKDFIPKLVYDGLSLGDGGTINFNLKMPILIQGKLPESIFPSLTQADNAAGGIEETVSETVASSTTSN